MTNLFVYGTLMDGCSLSTWLGNRPRQRATVGGHVLHLHTSGAYPVMVEGDGVVHGEVVPFSWGKDIDLVEMEVMAGYDLRWVPVGEDDWALAFVWSEPWAVGPPIVSGDWRPLDRTYNGGN